MPSSSIYKAATINLLFGRFSGQFTDFTFDSSGPLPEGTGSDVPWTAANGVATSGDISDDEISSFQITTTADSVTFDWFTDCEGGYDYFRFYKNGEEYFYYSGESEDGTFSMPVVGCLPVPSGSLGLNTFTWVYEKDRSESYYGDEVGIDNIVFSTTPSPVAKCASCLHGNGVYCIPQDGDEFPYYTLLRGETLAPEFSPVCEDPEDRQLTNDPEYFCTNGIDKAKAIHACMNIQQQCGSTTEFVKDLGDTSSSVTISQMGRGDSCTYKIEAQTGAPGFNVDMTEWFSIKDNVGALPDSCHPYDENEWTAYWMEWDSDVDTFQDSSWPALTASFFNTECKVCAQGDLVNRLERQGRNQELISANVLRSAIKKKQSEYDAYANLADSIYDLAEMSGAGYNMPKYPKQMTGPTFETTESMGGYGAHSGGIYQLKPTSLSGYKPFGALGQGARSDRGLTLNNDDQSAFMAVTVAEVGTHYYAGKKYSQHYGQVE